MTLKDKLIASNNGKYRKVIGSLDLKECPFCGGNVKYYNGWGRGKRKDSKDKSGREPSISCEGEDCGIGFSAGWFGYGISDENAKKITIEAWNKRVGE